MFLSSYAFAGLNLLPRTKMWPSTSKSSRKGASCPRNLSFCPSSGPTTGSSEFQCPEFTFGFKLTGYHFSGFVTETNFLIIHLIFTWVCRLISATFATNTSLGRVGHAAQNMLCTASVKLPPNNHSHNCLHLKEVQCENSL